MNIPIDLTGKNILICAIGGGFDIFGTLPLLYELVSLNKVLLSSFSLNKINPYFNYIGSDDLELNYFPEKLFFLSTKLPINFIGKCGVDQIRRYYKKLVEENNIDIIITVDCGVDSLMFGDEVNKGTIAEEYVNFSALKDIKIKKYHTCFGFGAESEEKISHYRVLENISTLIKQGGFIGSCSLTKHDMAFQYYKQSYEYVNSCEHKKSHIHPRIIKSIEGEFGNTIISDTTIMKSNKTEVFLSVLMGQYYFFDFDILTRNISVLDKLKNHMSFVQSVSEINSLPKIRENVQIPV